LVAHPHVSQWVNLRLSDVPPPLKAFLPGQSNRGRGAGRW
jgi:hypothetical protein